MNNRPMYAHPKDLPEAYDAASRIGAMIIKGSATQRWADYVADRWASAAHHATGVDLQGARTRIAWAIRDSAYAFQHLQQATERAIKASLVPLVEQRTPRGPLMAEAFNINEDAGSPLSEAEVVDLVTKQVYWSLQPKGANVSRR